MFDCLQHARRAAAAFLFLMASINCLSAHTSGRNPTLSMAVAQSELIFVGTVTDVAFRMSEEAGDEYAVLPHTFVTYQIEQVLRGNAPGDTITLRFLGGYSPETGRVLVGPGVRYFRVGDREIALVAGNGGHACPTVGCGAGRFRIVDGQAYSNSGLALRIAQDRIVAGPDALPDGAITMTVPAAPRARIAQMRRQLQEATDLDDTARRQLAARIQAMSAPRTLGLARPGPTPGSIPTAPPASQSELLQLLSRIAATAPAPPGRAASVDPNAPFRIPALTPPRVERPGRPATPRSLTEEQRRLRQNNGNPVLGAGADQ